MHRRCLNIKAPVPVNSCIVAATLARHSSSRRANRLHASSSDDSSPINAAIDVLMRDIDYLEDHTGLDLHTPLNTMADVHDTVVAALNPLAGEALQAQLEEQIAGMQQELAVAHQQVHANEERLEQSLRSLTQLETAVRTAAGAGIDKIQQQQQQQRNDTLRRTAPSHEQNRQVEELRKRRAGLQASLDLPAQLKHFWYPVEFSGRLRTDTLLPIELFGEQWVLFRDAQGAAACVRDQCCHRACPLSLGSIQNGQVQCAYHGWKFDGTGACTAMPSTTFCRGTSVTALSVLEIDGMLWIWPGEKKEGDTGNNKGSSGTSISSSNDVMPLSPSSPPPALPISGALAPPSGYTVHAELVMDVPVEHGILLENLLDLSHAPFTHTSTFAKGWPVPDQVRFQVSKVLGGSWQPYPIDMEFVPPCGVLSTIGLEQAGKIEHGARAADCKNHLHQMHICLPSKPGHTRLLYRMSLDFMGWAKYIPGITKFWESIASQVLGEDLVLVKGQQERLLQGGDIWGHPVAYDKLAVRYRRWRNAVAAGDDKATEQVQRSLRTMSAGELLFDPLESSEEVEE